MFLCYSLYYSASHDLVLFARLSDVFRLTHTFLHFTHAFLQQFSPCFFSNLSFKFQICFSRKHFPKYPQIIYPPFCIHNYFSHISFYQLKMFLFISQEQGLLSSATSSLLTRLAICTKFSNNTFLNYNAPN